MDTFGPLITLVKQLKSVYGGKILSMKEEKPGSLINPTRIEGLIRGAQHLFSLGFRTAHGGMTHSLSWFSGLLDTIWSWCPVRHPIRVMRGPGQWEANSRPSQFILVIGELLFSRARVLGLRG